MKDLTPSEQLYLVERHFEGREYDDIALRHGKSRGTVKNSVSKAVAKMKRALLARTGD